MSNALQMPYDCSSIAALITPEVQLEGSSNAVRMQSECSRNGCRIRFERPRIQTTCSWNTWNVLRMYLECNTNVPSASRIWPEYYPIGYKMLPNFINFTFISRNTTAIEYGPPGRCCFTPDWSFSKTCLKEMWRRLSKERGGEDPEDQTRPWLAESGRLKAELFRRAYGTDFAPM